jgi:hypothetical protein
MPKKINSRRAECRHVGYRQESRDYIVRLYRRAREHSDTAVSEVGLDAAALCHGGPKGRGRPPRGHCSHAFCMTRPCMRVNSRYCVS